MDDKPHDVSFWLEEINGKVQTPMRTKRKYKTKKRDTRTKISQSEVTNIIIEYVKQNNLFHKMKKKRIECDERLHSLFGRKTISSATF
ncbi:hypothetical protein E2542_SST24857 [Spatholobus suberectus]|nr:hypothetical protein E2542_SST24857 [Spatholobus suberectus]